MKFEKELELIDLFCEYLDKFNIQYKTELRKRSYYNEGFIDIAVKIGEFFIAIEAKLNSFKSVVMQASGNLVLCDYSYVLYPRYPKSDLLEKMKGWGVGLIYYDSKSKKFKCAFGSRNRYRKNQYWSKIKRNWDENRSGRHFNENEIPSHYTQKQIEALECKYEWTKKEEVKIEKKKGNNLEGFQ